METVITNVQRKARLSYPVCVHLPILAINSFFASKNILENQKDPFSISEGDYYRFAFPTGSLSHFWCYWTEATVNRSRAMEARLHLSKSRAAAHVFQGQTIEHTMAAARFSSSTWKWSQPFTVDLHIVPWRIGRATPWTPELIQGLSCQCVLHVKSVRDRG